MFHTFYESPNGTVLDTGFAYFSQTVVNTKASKVAKELYHTGYNGNKDIY
jgi:hypothetical protein